MISIIVAIAENGVIGDNNSLLWHISEDMRYFRATTASHTVVMGRKTYESIGRPLPKRRNIVLSRGDITIEGCEVMHSLGEAIEATRDEQEVFIIGGAEIYAQALPLAQRLYITHLEAQYAGDTSFPEWSSDEWEMVRSERYERGEAFDKPFSFNLYERKAKK